MSEFEAAYKEKVVPILKAHGLTESSERGRATPDSIFTRMFEFKTPSELVDKQMALRADSTWTATMRDLTAAFGKTSFGGFMSFTVYTTPAGPGKTVPAGPGKVVPAGQGTGHWRTYDPTDGLASGMVFSTFQDREGYLWFATLEGLSRYDGQTWTTFTTRDGLANNMVTSIFEDREGHLWFGADGGVSRYDPSAGSGQAPSTGSGRGGKTPSTSSGQAFTTFTTQGGLPTNGVAICQDREGNLWFGIPGGGVIRYDRKTPSTSSGQAFTTFTTKDGLASNYVRSALRDREGVLWFGTTGGVSRYDPSASSGQAWTTFTTKDGLASNYASSIFEDREGNLWFGTFNGVSRYDGKTFTTFTTKDGLANNRVSSIFEDREGNLWFGTGGEGTGGGGVSRYDGKPHSGSGQAWTTFTTEDGLAQNNVLSVFQDREGHLWFGTNGGGVSRYDGETWTTFADEATLALQDREGNLWFGASGGGVSRYDPSTSSGQGGKTWTTFTTQDGLASNGVASILEDREGNLWFGTNGGVSRYDPSTGSGQGREGRGRLNDSQDRSPPPNPSGPSGVGTFTTFTTRDGLASNGVRGIVQDREGVLWFGTSVGVSRYDGKTFTTFAHEDGLASYGTATSSTFQDREGNLWFGGFGGAGRYDGKTWTTFTTKDGLVNDVVRAIFQDREGHFWFGTQNGVSRYDGKSWTTFTTQDGLAASYVHSIFQDRAGHLWFSAWGGGFSRYDGKTWTTLTTKDGLASNGIFGVRQDREGNLWLGTERGVTRYRPPAPWPPPVFIDAVVADRRYEKASQLSLPSSAKLTAFEFHAISFKTRPEQMVYRYRLNGYDKDWRTTHERRVEYSNLPRGTYTFEVQAVDRDLVYSEKPATVTLRVHPPYTLIGLWSALSVAVALVSWQTARVIRRDRRLQEANTALSSANRDMFLLNKALLEKTDELEDANEQVQEATRQKSRFLTSMSHELRTPMNAIMGFTNLVLRRSGDALPVRQRENLEKVKQASDHLLALINDILDLSKVEAGRVDIKPVRFGVKALISACCATVSPLVKEGVALNPEVADDVGEAHTDEGKMRQIVINLLSNALKFTESGEVRVKCHVSSATQNQSLDTSHLAHGTHLVVAVSDTGVGIPADSLGMIFEEFRQVEGSHQQQKGTGLGLAITKKLTELLGGTIRAESEVGKGSTFTVKIPMVYGSGKGSEIEKSES